MKSERNIFSPDPRPLTIGVLVMPDSNAFSLAACVDPMRAANRRAGRRLFDWTYLSPDGGPVRLTAGFDVATLPLPAHPDFDVLFIVAGFRLEEQATPALTRRLRQLAPKMATIGGIDGGSWFMARAGLLDGRAATTHWEDLEKFADHFPAVTVRRDRYVISGPMVTTGGAAPCLDMMLDLIGCRWGAELALRVAGAFLYEPLHASSAPQQALPAHRIGKSDPAIGAAIKIMEEEIESPPSITRIAARVGLSQRRLEMLFADRLSISPGRFFLDLRLDEARRLITDTRMSLQEVAVRCGFSSQMAFARAFRTRFGATASDLRAGRI
ncbi:MAG: GlxA family transcriptional regulator [Paracoccaceae bacterium]